MSAEQVREQPGHCRLPRHKAPVARAGVKLAIRPMPWNSPAMDEVQRAANPSDVSDESFKARHPWALEPKRQARKQRLGAEIRLETVRELTIHSGQLRLLPPV